MGRKSEEHTRHQPVLCFETSPTYIAEMERKQRVRAKLGSGKVQQEHDTAMCFTPIEKRVHCHTLTPKEPERLCHLLQSWVNSCHHPRDMFDTGYIYLDI